MVWGTSTLILACALGALLLVAAGCDLKSRIIPNRLNLLIALGAPLFWWQTGMALWPDVALQLAVAFGVFAVFVGLFAIGAMGGGDVKMLGALALWVDPAFILPMLLVMALIGGGIALVMLVRKHLSKSTVSPEVPYGVAIAAAGLWALHQQFVNQFPPIPIT